MIAGLSGGAAAVAAVWLLQKSIETKLKLASDKALAKYEHVLARRLVFAELRTKRTFEVYPTLLQKCQEAGAAFRECMVDQHASLATARDAHEFAHSAYLQAKNYAIFNRMFIAAEAWAQIEALDDLFVKLSAVSADALRAGRFGPQWSRTQFHQEMEPPIVKLTQLLQAELLPEAIR